LCSSQTTSNFCLVTTSYFADYRGPGRPVRSPRHRHAKITALPACPPAPPGRHRLQHEPRDADSRGSRAGASPASFPADATGDRAQAWLRSAMFALAALAAAAAAVSWDAQYVLVRHVKHAPVIAALEAGIPDIGAVIFAALGIALALHGRRAIRARALNLACIGISLTMNALASAPGWRDLAIWVMPSAVYALASDTLIGVIRAWVIARLQNGGQILADDEATPIAIIGGLLLWLLRLALAPPSTISGFRRWAVEECPIAPGRKAGRSLPPGSGPARTPRQRQRPGGTEPRKRTGKQARMLALAAQRHD
jgi:hypothetical protein